MSSYGIGKPAQGYEIEAERRGQNQRDCTLQLNNEENMLKDIWEFAGGTVQGVVG